MSREERRRAEREQRRRNRTASTTASPVPPVRPREPEVLRSVLQELDRQKKPMPATTPGAGGDGGPPPAPPARVPKPVRPRPPEAPPSVVTAASLNATVAGCDAVEGTDPQALGMTYTFDAADDGEPYALTIRFEGRRTDLEGPAGPRDAFSALETVQVVPGSGKITITKRIENIAAGNWSTTALPVRDPAAGPPAHPVPALARTTGSTGYAPIIRVRAPGVRIGAWPGLVGLGAAVALTVQSLLAARVGLPVTPVLLLSLVACLIGLVGAKLYYLAENPQSQRGLMHLSTGMCIQGFVLAAVGTVVAGALILGLPVGRLVDVTAPGLMLGQAIGRVGCFLGGCCAGRPTRSRYGLWSSDRRLGARRIPTQLFESAMALAIGVVATVLMLISTPDPGGVVFVAVVAAYTLGRQLLFPLRNLPRNTTHGRTLTMVLCGVVLVAAIGVAVLA